MTLCFKPSQKKIESATWVYLSEHTKHAIRYSRRKGVFLYVLNKLLWTYGELNRVLSKIAYHRCHIVNKFFINSKCVISILHY